MRRRFRARPKFYGIIITLLILFFGVSCGVSQYRLNKASRHADALAQEKLAMENELRLLNEKLAYVQSDEYVQRAARNELKLIFPNEIRYVAR